MAKPNRGERPQQSGNNSRRVSNLERRHGGNNQNPRGRSGRRGENERGPGSSERAPGSDDKGRGGSDKRHRPGAHHERVSGGEKLNTSRGAIDGVAAGRGGRPPRHHSPVRGPPAKRARVTPNPSSNPLSDLVASTVSQLDPSVDVVDFTVARAHELTALRQMLRGKSAMTSAGGTAPHRRVYQSLSWHARRRTMSHSARRMPRRFRAAHEAQLLKSGALREAKRDYPGPRGFRVLRRYRGRARFLAALRALRISRPCCLETHVWHAKRFVMTDMGSFRVAKRCNDRGGRSMHRCVLRSALAHDASYMRVLRIDAATAEGLTSVLRRVVGIDDARRVVALRALAGERMVRDVVIVDTGKGGLSVGPVDVLRFPGENTGAAAMIWSRPETAESILSVLKAAAEVEARNGEIMGEIVVEMMAFQPGRISIFGPKADEVVARVMCGSDEVRGLLREGAAHIAADVVLRGAFDDRGGLRRAPWERDELDAKIKGDVEMITNLDVRDVSVRERMEAYGMKRLRPSTQVDTEGGDFVGEQVLMTGFAPLMAIQRGGDNGMYGWDLVVAKGWVMPLWLRVLYSTHGRAAGAEEVNALRVGCGGGSIFPEEFLDCEGGRSVVERARRELVAKVAKKPPGKRPPIGVGLIKVLEEVCANGGGGRGLCERDEEVGGIKLSKRRRAVAKKEDGKDDGSMDKGDGEKGDGAHDRGVQLKILRGVVALRKALGIIVGGKGGGEGSDDMLVSVVIRATERGVPRRGALIRGQRKCGKVGGKKTGKEGGDEDGVWTVGVVVDGNFGLACGKGVGRGLVSVTGVRQAWEAGRNGRGGGGKGAMRTKGRRSAKVKEVAVEFSNVGSHGLWVPAVISVVIAS